MRDFIIWSGAFVSGVAVCKMFQLWRIGLLVQKYAEIEDPKISIAKLEVLQDVA